MRRFPRTLYEPLPGAHSIVLISDVEMGVPGPFDDFPHDAFLAELILAYTQPPYDGIGVDLVLAGDIFDLLKTPYEGHYTRYITAEVALGKLESVLQAHPAFLESLRQFGTHPSGNKRIFFVAGNHDPELLFPEVQERLRRELEGVCSVEFPGLRLDLGTVHVEHGHQQDPLFAFDPEHLFLEHDGQKILHLPWGTCALLDVALPLRELFYHHDRLRPKSLVFQRMPNVRRLVLGAFRRYWTREYPWDWLVHRGDPTRRITWPMLKEIVYRFQSADPDLGRDSSLQGLFLQRPELRAIAVGHLHQPMWQMLCNRFVLQLGCMRDEYEIHLHDDKLTPIAKSYGEIVLVGDEVHDARLLHVRGPARPRGTEPLDIFDLDRSLQGVKPASLLSQLPIPKQDGRRSDAPVPATQDE